MRYCPHCKARRVTLQLLDRGESEERCATCGFRVQDAWPLAEPVPVEGEKVLCMDDDPVIRHLLTLTLAKSGFVPLTAPDGTRGLALAATERPRLILVDLMMPGLDGYEVCRRLKADPQTAHIPVIILTGQADPKLNVKAFRAGADLALMKPFQPGQLIAILRAALALKERRKSS